MQTLVRWIIVLTFTAIAALIVVPSASMLLKRGGSSEVKPPPDPPPAPRLALPPLDSTRIQEWLRVTERQIQGFEKQTAVYVKELDGYTKQVDVYKLRLEQSPPSANTYKLVVKDTLTSLVSTLLQAITAAVLAVAGATTVANVLRARRGESVEPFRLW